MFKPQAAFSGFSVNDQAKSKEFYTGILGLKVDDGPMGLTLHLPGGATVFVYPKKDHVPATSESGRIGIFGTRGTARMAPRNRAAGASRHLVR